MSGLSEEQRCLVAEQIIGLMAERGITCEDLPLDGVTSKLWRKQHTSPEQANVLLLHGGSYSTVAVFEPPAEVKKDLQYSIFTELAAQGFNVAGLDLNGYGLSEFSNKPHDIERYLKEIEMAIGRLRKNAPALPTWVIGWSFGAQLAARFAMQSNQIAGLVFYGGFWGGGHFGKPGFLKNFTPPPSSRRINRREHAAGDFKTQGAFDPSYRDRFVNWALAIDPSSPTIHLHEIARSRPVHEPTEIKVPTLIIHGENDALARTEDLDEYFNLLGSARKRHRVVRGGDHNLHQSHYLSEFLKEVREFIRGQ